jgi:D-threo-aldose 1-dehydrogenase
LAGLMLKAAFELNPNGIILFSSKDPDHMQHNVRVVDDAHLSQAALRLHKLLQLEPLPVTFL